MIFGINTTSDISKLLYETILKYHLWYLCQISPTNHAIICLYYYPQKVVIFTCRHFKLSWNTTALSQSNCRNFSCSSITENISPQILWLVLPVEILFDTFFIRTGAFCVLVKDRKGTKQWVLHWQNWLYPLSPNGDQPQFSPHNIHTYSRD